ncbi:unnamed protein product, partial [Choristocarpus tenellus]
MISLPCHIGLTLALSKCVQALLTRGEGCLVEARVCRVRRRQVVGEMDAIRVSEGLPFM